MGHLRVPREVSESGLTAQDKQRQLDRILDGMGSVLVAFSGGVDSAYLAVRAHRVLGSRALAVTADSESLADVQRRLALEIARDFGLNHRMVRTRELEDPLYARNEADRCYHCKSALFRTLGPVAAAEGIPYVAYGFIADDLGDYRPGQRAALEAGVRTPLAEAGMTKDDVRAVSRELGLPTWDLPSSPCLASRIPYGTAVTSDALRRVERAEAAVRALGVREFRVRHLGHVARIEIAAAELERLEPAARTALVAGVVAAGYREAEIDPEGYRRGRLNEALRVVAVR
jgi:uncharacterized protein